MKVKLPDKEWQDIGELIEVSGITVSIQHGQGMLFTSKSGVQVFFSQEDMNKLSGSPPKNRLF